MKKMFIDTGAWIALNNKKDKYYRDAVKANKDFLDKGYSYDRHFDQYGFIRLPIFL